MDSKLDVLIVGGAGFIGSHVNLLLQQNGYSTLVYDNFSRNCLSPESCGSHVRGDIFDAPLLLEVMNRYRPRAVMHFAALIDVGESFSHPIDYYHVNVGGTLNLLKQMELVGCDTFGNGVRPDIRTFEHSNIRAGKRGS